MSCVGGGGEGVSWNIVFEAYIRSCICWVGGLGVESVDFGVSFCSLALFFSWSFVDLGEHSAGLGFQERNYNT